MELNEGTIAKTWPKLLGRILHLGQVVDIEGYGRTIELSEPILIKIRNPLNDRICEGSGWGVSKLEEYYQQCVTPSNKFGFTYTYGQRFLAYPTDNGDGRYEEINQVENNMWLLDKDPTSRRAVSVGWIPEIDGHEASHPPCMLFQQRHIREGKLNLTTYFRSNDAWGAVPSNFYMLARWLEEDAEHLGVSVGDLYIITNAHIYARDWKDACDVSGNEEYYACLKELM